MKIQSRFKDYYDYVEHANGGGDPLCIYKRDHVVPDVLLDGTYSEGYREFRNDSLWLPNKNRSYKGTYKQYRGLCVAGRFFILAQDVEEIEFGFDKPLNHWHIAKEKFRNYVVGEKNAHVVDLAKRMAAPVFVWEGRYYAQAVRGRVPQLGSIGIGSILTAQQVYQEIAMFISNELRPVETADPPRTDVAKAESHGFDKRLSFRHRK